MMSLERSILATDTDTVILFANSLISVNKADVSLFISASLSKADCPCSGRHLNHYFCLLQSLQGKQKTLFIVIYKKCMIAHI